MKDENKYTHKIEEIHPNDAHHADLPDGSNFKGKRCYMQEEIQEADVGKPWVTGTLSLEGQPRPNFFYAVKIRKIKNAKV